MNVEISLATMNRENFDFLDSMNIQTNIVIGNQNNGFNILNDNKDNKKRLMITTPYRGVGKNRNTALCASYEDTDVVLFADDDMKYIDGYQTVIENAYGRHPDADIIIFNCNIKNAGLEEENNSKASRVRIHNFGRYGTVQISIKKKSLQHKRLSFSELYGGGSIYSCGEDSLFLRDALRKKCKIYYIPEIIAEVDQQTSTWFTGINDKFLFDKSVLSSALFPKAKYVSWIYFYLKFAPKAKQSKKDSLKTMLSGIKSEKNILSYYDNQDKRKAEDE